MRAPTDSVSAPVRDVRYELTFMRANAQQRAVDVDDELRDDECRTRHPVAARVDAGRVRDRATYVALGHEALRLGRRSRDLVGQAGLRHVAHSPGWSEDGQRDVSLSSPTRSTTRIAWTQPDFLLFNGTNVFIYPEGQPLEFRATVIVHTEPDWHVATGMTRAPMRRREPSPPRTITISSTCRSSSGGSTSTARASSEKWMRLATYPAGVDRAARCGRRRGSRSSA